MYLGSESTSIWVFRIFSKASIAFTIRINRKSPEVLDVPFDLSVILALKKESVASEDCHQGAPVLDTQVSRCQTWAQNIEPSKSQRFRLVYKKQKSKEGDKNIKIIRRLIKE
ncbi:hypothetical protein CDAR_25871 [Caerostris darwini]|uniref:Uncharacterized protein n=1 Tax=Caerostris darwini TaxID=1538125 RepID=A0AAV4PGT6_9ARAC|nr:hypothetical protein CDAR_25871 [Caerostris darwini]